MRHTAIYFFKYGYAKVDPFLAALILALIIAGPAGGFQKPDQPEVIAVRGLGQPVEIVRDKWGIPHISARSESDLFFAQGFNAASDRLFQLELWRRQATGTMAEWLGPKAVRRDTGARLLKYRGDMEKELAYYHPRAKDIIGAFVRGINAYIDLVRNKPGLLPLEFRLLGAQPGYWTPEIVVSRHNGLYRNATAEVALARAVGAVGSKKLEDLLDLHPGTPSLEPAPGVDLSLVSEKLLELYREARAPVVFGAGDLRTLDSIVPQGPMPLRWIQSFLSDGDAIELEGSDNWTVAAA